MAYYYLHLSQLKSFTLELIVTLIGQVAQMIEDRLMDFLEFQKATSSVCSNTQAGYRAIAYSTFELLWLESLMAEIIIPFHTPTLLYDNLIFVLLSYNSVLHARTKHIKLDNYFVREIVVEKRLLIQHAPIVSKLAYTMIKSLGTTSF